MHIKLKGTRVYRAEWGTDKRIGRFIKVQPIREGTEKFAREIARWVADVFDELSDAYDKAVRDIPFEPVKWTR